jgi:hypothetical protein
MWAVIGGSLIALGFGLKLFGEAFRSNTLLFALLWIAAPIFAYFLNRRSLFSCFTLTGMRRIQVVLMIVVIAISFAMFGGHYIVRNQIGERFVEGYRSWTHRPADGEEPDPYAPNPTYPGDDWMVVKNPAGEWGLMAFELLLMVAVFAFPVITWKASDAAIHRVEEEVFLSKGPPEEEEDDDEEKDEE